MANHIRSLKDGRARTSRAVHGRVRRVTGRFLFMMLLLVLLAGVGLLLLHLSDDVRLLFQFVARYSAFAYAAQLAVTIGLWFGWTRVVALLVSRGVVSEFARPVLLQRRGRWCGALLTIQLILLVSAVGRPV